MRDTIRVSLNGLDLRIAAGIRLELLMESLWAGAGQAPSLVSVDADYIPPEAWAEVVLREGSRIDTIA